MEVDEQLADLRRSLDRLERRPASRDADGWDGLALEAGHWPGRRAERVDATLPRPRVDVDAPPLRAWLAGLALGWAGLVRATHDPAAERARAEDAARRALSRAGGVDVAKVRETARDLAAPSADRDGEFFTLDRWRKLLVCLATLRHAEDCP